MDDERPKESTAKIKALLSQDVSQKVIDFVRDLRKGKEMSYSRWYDMVKMMGPSTSGWIRFLRRCEAEDGTIITSETGYQVKMNLCPWKHPVIITKFLEDLFSELNTKLEEGADIFSLLGYMRGRPEFEPEQPESSLAGLFSAKAKGRKRGRKK